MNAARPHSPSLYFLKDCVPQRITVTVYYVSIIVIMLKFMIMRDSIKCNTKFNGINYLDKSGCSINEKSIVFTIHHAALEIHDTPCSYEISQDYSCLSSTVASLRKLDM